MYCCACCSTYRVSDSQEDLMMVSPGYKFEDMEGAEAGKSIR